MFEIFHTGADITMIIGVSIVAYHLEVQSWRGEKASWSLKNIFSTSWGAYSTCSDGEAYFLITLLKCSCPSAQSGRRSNKGPTSHGIH